MRILLVVVALLVLCDSKPSVLQLVMLTNTNQTQAICNDGSPAGYYFKQGRSERWIVHFQGGGWCFNEVSCQERWATTPTLMSSKQWASTYAPSGEFDDSPIDNFYWHDATYVYMPYCTSDSFSGDLPASNSTFGWAFRGKKVLAAIINDAVAKGLGKATQVLVSGCSAGGAAVLANADYVVSLLPSQPDRIVKAHMDAGFFQEIVPMVSGVLPMEGYFQQGQVLWGGIPDTSCAAAYPSALWRCYMGEFGVAHVTTPTLIHQETEDFVQLAVNGDTTQINTTVGEEYINTFRANITASLQAATTPHSVFAPACYWHCSTESSQFWQIKIKADGGGVSDSDALAYFFFDNESNEAHILIDACTGFSCSEGCPNQPPPQ